MPRTITHESHLKRCTTEVARFYEGIAHLEQKLAAVLVQLPASLEYDGQVVRSFFKSIPPLHDTKVVCEPRNPTWFTSNAEKALRELGVSRVAADPARCPGAHTPGGAQRFAYFRWHGAPHLYYSKYSETQIGVFADSVINSKANETWCIFDNTARHAAWDDALQFMALLRRRAPILKTDEYLSIRQRHVTTGD